MAEKKLQLILRLRKRIPLTVKMVLVVLMVGLFLWAVMDHFQDRYLRSLLEDQYKEMISQMAVEQRMNFDSYIKKYFQSVKLFTAHKRFDDYLENLESKKWTEDKNIQIKYYKQPPRWFPDRSILRSFIPAHFAILLDGEKRVREVYIKGKYELPAFFLQPNSVLYQLSQNQSFMTSYNNVPYIIASKNINGPEGRLRGILTLACPIDENFITHSYGVTANKRLVALVTGLNPYIIASNDKVMLPKGAEIDTLKEHFLIEEEGFFDYGNSDLLISLATFFPKEEIESHYAGTLNKQRVQRAITNIIFILTFSLIIYWITHRIQKMTKRITDFSHKTLGMEPVELPKGDQLHILKDRFKSLTKEVILSRETIKRQAEEQTRLIVNNAFNAIITTDNKGAIITWNPRAEAIFGWSHEEAVGKMIYDIIVPQNLHEKCKKTIKIIMTVERQPVSREQIKITCSNREGHEFPGEFSVSSAKSENSYIFIFIIRDITERIESEKKIKDLLESVTKVKTEWEKTFDSVDELILLVDKELSIIRCNKSFAEFARKSSGDLVGSKCHEYLLCGQEWLNIIDHDQAEKQMPRTEIKTEDGRWLYISHLPLFDEKKGFLYTIITAIDITELKNTQQILTESKTELNDRVSELEKFYEMAVNRELKMVTLKKEIAKLKEQNKSMESVNK